MSKLFGSPTAREEELGRAISRYASFDNDAVGLWDRLVKEYGDSSAARIWIAACRIADEET